MSKVLVLCQRRKGMGSELDSVNAEIDKLAHDLLGEVDIKYVNPKTTRLGEYVDDGEVDMEFVFGNNKETAALDRDYALIICNTCPFRDMNYEIIHRHLKDDGYLAITAYNSIRPVTVEKLEREKEEKYAYLPKIQSSGFNRVPLDRHYNALLFQKDPNHVTYESTFDISEYDRASPEELTRRTKEYNARNASEREKLCAAEPRNPKCTQINWLERLLQDPERSNVDSPVLQAKLCDTRDPKCNEEILLSSKSVSKSQENDDDMYNGGKRTRRFKSRSLSKRKKLRNSFRRYTRAHAIK